MTITDPPPDGTVAMSEVTSEERLLAARNHGFLTEALRYATTPVEMHYLLTHYDVPAVDVAQWKLQVGGLVQRPITLSLDEIKARPVVTLPLLARRAKKAMPAGTRVLKLRFTDPSRPPHPVIVKAIWRGSLAGKWR